MLHVYPIRFRTAAAEPCFRVSRFLIGDLSGTQRSNGEYLSIRECSRRAQKNPSSLLHAQGPKTGSVCTDTFKVA